MKDRHPPKEKDQVSIAWHTLPVLELEKELKTNFGSGLSADEAALRLEREGLNKLPEGKTDPLPIIFFRQFQSPLIYVLLLAGGVVFLLREFIDAILIVFVLFFNAVVGTIQEGKAQNILLALKKFIKTNATVLRDGKEIIIPAEEIVPGDIIILQAGEKVPADARIIEARSLRVNEAALTGESLPVQKAQTTFNKKDLPLTRRKNMVFLGTAIAGGAARAVTIKTGISTEIGKISEKIAAVDTEIPLKKDLRHLSRLILGAVAIAALAVFTIGIFLNQLPAKDVFKTGVALAVSAIPEGLPIVLTLVLARGVWRMAKSNVLVKKLQAVEALGQARIIAVDKTGTITKNELVIRKVFIQGKTFDISGTGYNPEGQVKLEKETIEPLTHPELLLAGKIAAFCASARVALEEEEKIWKVAGDPTEAAMLIFGEKIGFKKSALEKESPRLSELPFDYKTKYHLTSNRVDNKQFITITGAPEAIFPISKKVLTEEKELPLTPGRLEDLNKIFHQMSRAGLRVVAFAFRETPLDDRSPIKKIDNFTFAGFYGMEDSLREDVEESIDIARAANMRVVMITGDFRLTAIAIAKEADIYRDGDQVLTGEDLANLTEKELDQEVAKTTVFARVTPEDKMKIIASFRRRGEIVAMTGDGVNDAPPLVAADLGVAMGKIGTEVAKEAADIVLLDDNFGNMIKAAEEGRNIYKTIKKVVLYLFSTNLGEVLTIIVALFLGFPLPILAAQILWLNLVTDGFLDVALAMEPKESGLLKRKFEHPKKYFRDKLMVQRLFIMALPMTAGTLYLFSGNYQADLSKALTISLVTLAAFQWANAWNCRSEEKSIFQKGFLSNKFLVGATLIVIGLQITAIYAPFMQKILRTVPIAPADWIAAILVALSVILFEEIRKIFYRRKLQLAPP